MIHYLQQMKAAASPLQSHRHFVCMTGSTQSRFQNTNADNSPLGYPLTQDLCRTYVGVSLDDLDLVIYRYFMAQND